MDLTLVGIIIEALLFINSALRTGVLIEYLLQFINHRRAKECQDQASETAFNDSQQDCLPCSSYSQQRTVNQETIHKFGELTNTT